jgi:signal transduction histidine kinase
LSRWWSRSPIAINQIEEKIALASRLRDVNPQEALDIVGSVREAPHAYPKQEAGQAELWSAECALNAAWANLRLGQFGKSAQEADDGLRLFRKLGNTQGTAGCLLIMGVAMGEDGRNEEALKLYQEAQTLFLAIGDKIGLARAINASGTSYRRLGDAARAIEAYGNSVGVARDNGDSQGVARALCNIGYVYLYERKYEDAIRYAKQALAMERDHSNLAAELSNCCNLVQALVSAGRPQEAIDFMADYDLEELARSGLYSFLQLSHSLSEAYLETGRTAEAGVLLTLGIERTRRDGNHRELGSFLCAYARMQRISPESGGAARGERLASARAALEEALARGYAGDPDIVRGIREEFCALCRDEGSWNEAFEHLEEAHRIEIKLSAASADERLARQRSERDAADQRARADAEAREHEIERKVLQSQKTESLGILAGGMVHHFNNLLASILGNAELAQQNADLVPEALSEIKLSGKRAADLCQQIMMYTGRSVHRMEAVDLLALIHESIRLFRLAGAAGCEVICEFPRDPVFVWGDRAELAHIFLNLVTNSAEARATSVRFQAQIVSRDAPSQAQGDPLDPGKFVELCISDNGEGMAPEVLARIFEPFFSTRFAGRGLGLPAAMGLVRAHKGTIAVESTPGSGTTVHLHLPVAKNEAAAPPKAAPGAEAKARQVVLVAEDEEVVRKVIVKCLTRMGWTALEAADGEEAVRIYRENIGQIDLLLSDYLMPRANGLDAALQVRLLNPRLPVILMSGFMNEATLENFRSNGFEHFLKKPFELQELRELLNEVSIRAR